jgi:hypothetical protein
VESELFTSYLNLIKFHTSKLEYPEKGVVTAKNLALRNVNQHLHRYLVDAGIVVDVDVGNAA